MIEIKNVSKIYNKKDKIIDNLSCNIQNGEIFGFLGPNGAGKTTTIKMITGITDITEGDIIIDGYSIKDKPINAKKQFGFVSDNPNVFDSLKAIEYLNFIADAYNVSTEDRIKKIEYYSKKFELFNYLNDKIKTYSHGMRQKLVIIGSLLHEPQNWILDEPLTGLDPKSLYTIKEIMKEYAKKNKCVFFSTHILEIAEVLCDKIGIINNGKLLYIGTYNELKNELKQNKSLEELFMEIIKND